MKPTVVSADVLFEDHRASLKWEWVAGLGASARRFDEVAVRAARSGADLVGYLGTWSSVQTFAERQRADPVKLVEAELAAACGDADATQAVRWPLYLRVGRVGKG